MKKITILFLLSIFSFVLFAQDADKKEKKSKDKVEKTEKSKDKDKKKSKEKKDKKDDGFIYESEDSEDYRLDDRQEVSTPSMPLYEVEQPFNQKKKKKKQQDAFMNDEYYFPAKPKNAWQIGISGGLAKLNGDIGSNMFKGAKPFVPGYTFGLNVKKSWTYLFSTRLSYHFMEMWNTETQISTASSTYLKSVSLYSPTLYTTPSNFFHNSTTVMHDATLDLMFTFGNKKYHKERSKVVFNLFASIGGAMFRTWADHLDANGNPYDYGTLAQMKLNGASDKDVMAELEDMRDGGYETAGQSSGGAEWKGYTITPIFGGGAGLTFRLGRVVDLDLEGRFVATTNDLLEGLQYAEPIGIYDQADLTPENDTYVTLTTGLTFKLVGKNKTEPLTNMNPLHYSYKTLAENDPQDAIDELLEDDDEDGVPNRLDEEEDTPKDAPVDPKGRALDSDGDGVIDLNDQEPFSPPGYDVDEDGVAQVPVVNNISYEDYCSSLTELPSIHFDKDKYYILPEFYAHLHQVAERMLLCDDINVVATGMTDKDYGNDYNDQLSWNRVNMAIDYLTENYGLDRARFIVQFDGEKNAQGSSLIEEYQDRRVTFRIAEEGEAGESAPAAPFPDMNAGSDK